MGKGKRREKDEEREIMRMMKEERRQNKEETQHKIAESHTSMIQSIPLILSPSISAHLLLSLAASHLSLLANTCLCHSFS